MKFLATVDKGRITIPIQVRRELGIGDGDQLVLTFEDGLLQIHQKHKAAIVDQQKI